MKIDMFENVCIIGLGLIGGCIAMDLRKNGIAKNIIGVDNSEEHRKEALNLKIVDEILRLEEAVNISDFVVVAIPVDYIIKVLPIVLDNANDNTVITDVGSTKSTIIKSVENHKRRKQYVPSHPMTGTENSGPSAAFSGLFQNKITVICNKKDSFDKAVDTVIDMYKKIGSDVIFMEAHSHDEHVGYVSHLSHVISYALAVTVLEKEKSDSAIFNIAAAGFASTARLAKSSSDMWVPIFEENKEFILPIIDVYLEKLNDFKQYLQNDDTENLTNFISEANKIKRVV